MDPPLGAGFLDLAGFGVGFAVALAAAGTTFFGAALPKVGFAASLDRAATAGPAPVLDSIAFDRVALPLAGAGFLALVAIGRLPHVSIIAVADITAGKS
ncbi:hypothetical protein [Mesorhizobium tianshanense]|uniref:hypothetical protein n=1 Tax=Mesorhizobium tianshanense TaxID=39844 RepID=UPI001F0A3237|nr:hypothetical protein [Mesorhizobium tianshanense]